MSAGPRPRLRAWLARRLAPQDLDRPGAPRESWLLFGALLAFLLGVQFASGILLLLHYDPDPEQAFASVERIMRDVSFGWMIRLVHVHAANLVLVVAFVHLVRSAVLGAYKEPRELVWITGCTLLVLLLGMGLSGYILPWSQLSYWATTVVTSSLAYVPLVGERLVHAARGGEMVGPATFRRAFVAHVSLLPLLIVLVLALHLYLIRCVGLAETPRRGSPSHGRSRPFSLAPRLVLQAAAMIAAASIALFGVVTFAPELLQREEGFVPADPLDTPPGVKPEWYFLWAYQLPRLLPEGLALLVEGAAVLLLFALPFLDRSPWRHPLDRPRVALLLLLGALALVVLTALGSRE